MTASSILQGLTPLLSSTAGQRIGPASKCAAGDTFHASERPAADEGVSLTKPVPSIEGSEKPSQQLQQQPPGSSHVPAGTSEQAMAQGSNARLPGVNAPTSEKYHPDSVHYLTLQGLWHKCNFAGEATFRVYVAIGVVLEAAAESAEQLKCVVQRVGVLVTSLLMRSHSHERHAFCLDCQRENPCQKKKPCCLMGSSTPSPHAQY